MSVIMLNAEDNDSPALAITCQRDGAAIDLSGATVELIIIDAQSREVTNSGHQSCTITTAASGLISYQPAVTDFPSAGRYLGELKVTFSGGRIERLNELINFVVRPKLA